MGPFVAFELGCFSGPYLLSLVYHIIAFSSLSWFLLDLDSLLLGFYLVWGGSGDLNHGADLFVIF